MNPNNDEVIARLQASLRAVADRTPIGEARAIGSSLPGSVQPRSRTTVTVISAAAAVAAIAAVSAAVASNHRTHTVSPGAGGLVGPASSASASPAPVSIAAPIPTPSSVPTPVRSGTVGSAVPQASPACVPENYYVIASPAQLAGLTYLLPAAPVGYTFYGAWGTISRNDCPGSQTWYAEYDQSPDATTNISISIRHSDGGPIPAASASVATADVHGHQAFVLNKSSTYGILVWQADGLDFYVDGPMAGGNPESLVALANTLSVVSPTDPRIVAPLNCQIAPGNTCPDGPQPKPTPTVSPTPSPTN